MRLRTNKDNANLICYNCGKPINIGDNYLENEYEKGYEIHVSASPLLGGRCRNESGWGKE